MAQKFLRDKKLKFRDDRQPPRPPPLTDGVSALFFVCSQWVLGKDVKGDLFFVLGVRSVVSLVGFERLSIILGPLRPGGGRRCFFCDVRLKKRGVRTNL